MYTVIYREFCVGSWLQRILPSCTFDVSIPKQFRILYQSRSIVLLLYTLEMGLGQVVDLIQGRFDFIFHRHRQAVTTTRHRTETQRSILNLTCCSFLFYLFQDKEETAKDETGQEVKENGVSEPEEATTKTPEGEKNAAAGDQPVAVNNDGESVEKTAEKSEESKVEENKDESKKNKEKTKKKKWSFRSISFSKKDKSKPGKEPEKNGELKETPAEVSVHF